MTTSRPVRIAFLGSRGIPARYGGFETFVEEVSRRLVDRGIEVTVFCETSDEPGPSEYNGVHLEYVRAWAPGPLRTIQFDFTSLWRARRGFDVVYMLGYGASLFCGIPRFFGSQVWINMDGLEWKRSKWSFPARLWLKVMEGLAFHSADRLIFDNAALRDVICERRTKPIESSVLEYGGPLVEHEPDPTHLERFDVTPGNYLLVVCRFEPENHVLEIVEGYRASNCERPLIIVANTDLGTDYTKRCTALSGDRVRFVGTVYDQEVLLALRTHCFAYLHGHSVGGTNPSLLEAMACGNLILAHDNVFNRETMSDAGLFFSDVQGLRETIDLADSLSHERANALRESCRTKVREYYDWNLIADRYTELLKGGSPDSGWPGARSDKDRALTLSSSQR